LRMARDVLCTGAASVAEGCVGVADTGAIAQVADAIG
jgi:hypothetical protein